MRHDVNNISLNIYKIACKNFNNKSINKSLLYLLNEYNASKIIIKCNNDNNGIKYMATNNKNNNKNNNMSEVNFMVNNKIYTLAIYDHDYIEDSELYAYAKIYSDLIGNIITVNKLIDKAYISDITNLFNRRYLNDVIIPNINNISNNYTYNKINLSVSYGDLYRLKYINDNLGHDIGNEYITKVSHILKKHFSNENSYIIHVSGDEFIIISISKNLNEIEKKLDEIEEEVSNINFNIKDNINVTGHINFGTSFSEYGPVDLNIMINQADMTMSDNKNKFYKKNNILRRK